MKITQDAQSSIMAELLASSGLPVNPVHNALVEGTVVRFEERYGYWVDFGGKVDGLCPKEEVGVEPLVPGQKAWFLMEDVGPFDDDTPQLSVRKANAWREMQKLKESNAIVTVKVVRAAGNGHGGLAGLKVTCQGLHGFVPFSKMGFGPAVARTIAEKRELFDAKVTEVDSVKNRLIFDMSAMRREKEENARVAEELRDKRFDAVKMHETVTGTVALVVEYGYFVDIGDRLNALLHNEEHTGVKLAVGDQVTGRITRRERDKDGKRRLAISTQQPFFDRVQVGDTVTGSVRNVASFGVFVRLSRSERVDGLLHISQMIDADNLMASLTPHQEIQVRIIDVNRNSRRISLSMNGLSQD
ncbi:MAG TPA: S1 RNA-binding domain-containing protein [Candidatus Obscuribacterales bacterium]